jgi:D-3-phosphoglycerate dehydrogenase
MEFTMKVLISDPMSEEGLSVLQKQDGLTVVNQPGMSPSELLEEVRDAHALVVRSKTKVTEEVIKAADNLRVIGRAGAGVDNINLDAATRKGIVVMNTPGGNSASAAEHALALLLSLARRIPFAHGSMVSGQWNKSAFIGRELMGKTLGILGLGKIGSVLARRSQGFDMKVMAFDPFVTEAYAADLGVELHPFEEVLRNADMISLHLPLNQETEHLIRKDTISLMKDGALLANTARGALIHEEDLIEALESGKLGGAALDVFANEPEVSERLRSTEGVVLTPHIAGSTREAQAKVGVAIAGQIANYLKNDVIVNAVNFPSVTTKEQESLLPHISLGEKLGTFISNISQIRVSEIGLRYYGDLASINHKPLGNYILKAILTPIMSEQINAVNARKVAADRGISVIETVSTRERDYSNLISIQLRSETDTEWIEGAILHEGNLRLVSVDGIPAETQLGDNVLFMRNEDIPGVIGHVGTILGEQKINIAGFVLGRTDKHDHAVGVMTTDSPIPSEIAERICELPAIRFAKAFSLECKDPH